MSIGSFKHANVYWTGKNALNFALHCNLIDATVIGVLLVWFLSAAVFWAAVEAVLLGNSPLSWLSFWANLSGRRSLAVQGPVYCLPRFPWLWDLQLAPFRMSSHPATAHDGFHLCKYLAGVAHGRHVALTICHDDEDRSIPPVRPVTPFGRSGLHPGLSGSLGPLECSGLDCLPFAGLDLLGLFIAVRPTCSWIASCTSHPGRPYVPYWTYWITFFLDSCTSHPGRPYVPYWTPYWITFLISQILLGLIDFLWKTHAAWPPSQVTHPPSPLCFLASHDPHPPDLLFGYLLAPCDLDCTPFFSFSRSLAPNPKKLPPVVTEISSEETVSSSWLVGSVLSVKPVEGDSVVRIFRSVWKAKNVSEIAELRSNFFLIKPSSAEAMDMILKRRPWVVHDDLFSIKPFIPAWNSDAYDFKLMTIWVRVYKLPLGAMNRDMGLQLGGCIVDIDLKKLQYGSWLRVKPQQPQPGPRKHSRIEYFSEGAPAPEPATADKAPPQSPRNQTAIPTEAANVNRQVDTAPTHVSSDGSPSAGVAGTGTGGATMPIVAVDSGVATEKGAGEATVPFAAETVAVPCDQAQGRSLPADSIQSGQPDSTVPAKAAENNAAACFSTAPVRSSKRTIQGRVFRAKYFRSGSLLDAGLPDHASYAWKGLYSALQDLRGGFLPLSDSRPTQYRWSGHDTGRVLGGFAQHSVVPSSSASAEAAAVLARL
ncbi:hypothetical protein V6N11_035742 [Hibiscus sabdariffa]|uniref:DUF4283 domain-containing protein n=1 Tax=Hibiscus sabdariffa TaxID=183260 RepID=A0ABR2R8E5_9ROSI